MANFEEEYLDVLQNIEAAIVSVYREQSELTDYDADQALGALLREYQAQQHRRSVSPPRLGELALQVYERVKVMCEWRLGNATLPTTKPFARMPAPKPLTLDEVIACLKRIRKSIQRWNKEGGRRGYLQFIAQYV